MWFGYRALPEPSTESTRSTVPLPGRIPLLGSVQSCRPTGQ